MAGAVSLSLCPKRNSQPGIMVDSYHRIVDEEEDPLFIGF